MCPRFLVPLSSKCSTAREVDGLANQDKPSPRVEEKL